MESPRRGRKSTEKKPREDLQESLNKWKSKGHRFEGKGIKAAKAESVKGKMQFQGKKMKVWSDDERDENDAAGSVKTDKDEQHQNRKQNGTGDQ